MDLKYISSALMVRLKLSAPHFGRFVWGWLQRCREGAADLLCAKEEGGLL